MNRTLTAFLTCQLLVVAPPSLADNSALVPVTSLLLREDILANETFNYPDGVLEGNSGGSGWADTWDIQGPNSGAVLSGRGSPIPGVQAFRTLREPVSVNPGDTIYVSFDFFAKTNGSNDFAGLSFFSDSDEQVFFGMAFNRDQYSINVTGLYNGDDSRAPVPDNTTRVKILGEVIFGESKSTARMWVNPKRELPQPDDAHTFNTSSLETPWNRVRIAGSSTSMTDFDNLKIAKNVNDLGFHHPDNLVTTGIGKSTVVICEGGGACDESHTFTIAWSQPPKSGTEVIDMSVLSGDADAIQFSPAQVSFDASNYHIPATITVTAAQDPDFTDDDVVLLISPDSGGSAGVTYRVIDAGDPE